MDVRRLALVGILSILGLAGRGFADAELEQGFVNPPAAARPWVLWFWLNGNITREGITADLEAMQRVGIGGAMIMEVNQGTPRGPVDFMSKEWRALFKHTVDEARRLGLEISMNNDAGWNGSGGPWVPLDKAMQYLVFSEVAAEGGKRFDAKLPQPPSTDGYYRDIAVLAFPARQPGGQGGADPRVPDVAGKSVAWRKLFREIQGCSGPIARKDLVNLTDRMGADGHLAWDPPAGAWTVVRFGHTFTGARNHPAPDSGSGPECDKLSREGIEAHFNGMMAKLIEDVGPAAGTTLVATHIDSWEVGGQNWTPRLPEEFLKRRGYELLPFLPAMAGRVVDSVDVTERFLWDLRTTISELLAENYVGGLRDLAHAKGLSLSMESYTTPANDLEVACEVDEPVCEFWWPDGGWVFWSMKAMASAAHVNNRPIVGAEAFTAGKHERWQAHPCNMKDLGDRAFCEGVNRMVFHRYAMQPWADRRPGMMMGRWGSHYERTQTWWEMSSAWHMYVTRCQYLLRQGQFVADVLDLQAEEPMKRYRPRFLSGYDFDACSPRTLLQKVTVKDGRLTLPHGAQYRLLRLSDTRTMTLPMLRKIHALVDAGAAVLGNPPASVPGLEGYPGADAELKKLADLLWGTDEAATDRVVGKGRVFRNMSPEDVLSRLGVEKDFASDRKLRWIHRAAGGTDVYFVASDSGDAQDVACTFRVAGRQPEFWEPATGRVVPARCYEAGGGKVRAPVRLDPWGSVFVVFRHADAPPARRITSVTLGGSPLVSATQSAAPPPAVDLVRNEVWQVGAYGVQTADGRLRTFDIGTLPAPVEVEGAWTVRFPPGWGAPAEAVFEKLGSWSQHADPGIKYFSGTATYVKQVELPRQPSGKQRLYLDLGGVAVMARARLNGHDLGVLWKPPYRVEITDVAQQGTNQLEVDVANLWPNRMIGDEQLPEDSARNGDGTLKEWPQWLQEGKPSPTGRFTFSTWRMWGKGEALQESGLLGPVRIVAAGTIPAGF